MRKTTIGSDAVDKMVRVTPEDHAAVKARADRDGVKVWVVVHRAIALYTRGTTDEDLTSEEETPAAAAARRKAKGVTVPTALLDEDGGEAAPVSMKARFEDIFAGAPRSDVLDGTRSTERPSAGSAVREPAEANAARRETWRKTIADDLGF